MLRYLTVHWDPADQHASDSARLLVRKVSLSLAGWKLAARQRGALVWTRPSQAGDSQGTKLDHQSGVILGTIFPREGADRSEPVRSVGNFGAADSRTILNTAGRDLVNRYWGSYVAILCGDTGTHILRAPLGTLKCFLASSPPFLFSFSDVEDFARLRVLRLTVNWDCIRAQAACADYLGRETAIREITAVEAGECVHFSRGRLLREFYWNPCELAKTSDIRTFDGAAHTLRSATKGCVGTWATHYGNVIHHLSGGIDSSISAACARRVLPRSSMVCVNYFSSDMHGDERRFARDVAQRHDLDLVELERSTDVDLQVFQTCVKTAWPALDFSGYGQYRKEVEFAGSHGARAILMGELGDNLFEHGIGTEAVADYVWRHGLRPGVLSVAVDCALRRNLSVWTSLARGIRSGKSKLEAERWNSLAVIERELDVRVADLTLLRSDVLVDVRRNSQRYAHPWFESLAGTPPGKFLLIYGLLSFGSYEPPFSKPDDVPLVAPLASQPVAEICLRIPSYFCIRGSIDRAVARSAFSSDLPPSVLHRTTKGTPEMWSRDVIRRNQSFLRSFLLDGILVREGILDPARVEAAFSNQVHASKAFVSDVIVQLYIEAWLRQWQAELTSLAAA
jgi:asparagine synthase (glutamine-hydrolysing)